MKIKFAFFLVEEITYSLFFFLSRDEIKQELNSKIAFREEKLYRW